MKQTVLTLTTLFFLGGSAAVLAEQQSGTEAPMETDSARDQTPTILAPEASRPMAGMGKMHRGTCHHNKGHGGMKHGGGGRHAKGQHDKGHHSKQDRMVQRLDMIEARLAKIEAMLETLMRR